MSKANACQVGPFGQYENVSTQENVSSLQQSPRRRHHDCYDLFLIFKDFRRRKAYKELIDFLVTNYANNVKNKTFNFVHTGHLFHSLYAYIPAVSNVERERKQIRLSEECVHKLFVNTINDFKLYTEIFDYIQRESLPEKCPCELLVRRLDQIKNYVNVIKSKKFDSKPPKLKKEPIDNILFKYSINWKNILLKKKIAEANNGKSLKKKRTFTKRNILTDDVIYLNDTKYTIGLPSLNGLSLKECDHKFVTIERQMRAGDEAVSFIRYCQKCNRTSMGYD
ncbi:Late expression factor 5 lef-5 [Spodoptera exigua multiple nucleopolyhedrovirus]|nr:Late expression factor 5 lef-5 [Spodoptera exigua multiple nucleopolyhedrovirus]CDG72544.1 Late expression factor 5 lef-5 [Spodoptera exigua multiple nucleopolyhedrovirus]CDG72681.1 Late expression factor 5 lef-5 [Spodoptera exigua multiple nucleopolyhedrovirus]CDG72818.1 Late expression factor 5 lef-5 [Spodoptera exigua multiple nucleopolyhedrovirus]CDG72970.1 Late expression factor 5 lef-5 [Spodoptera exigua multiple nucleopolyhedrovirus]